MYVCMYVYFGVTRNMRGGAPTVAGPTGCQTGTGTNDSGLWIFTREQKRDEALVQKAGNFQNAGWELAVGAGIDTSIAVPYSERLGA